MAIRKVYDVKFTVAGVMKTGKILAASKEDAKKIVWRDKGGRLKAIRLAKDGRYANEGW